MMTVEEAATRSTHYAAFAEAFKEPRPEEAMEDWAKAYIDSFEPSITKGACSLNESEYARSARNTVYEELLRFYNFFGLERDEQASLPDHLSVELQFMHYLTYLEAKLKEEGIEVEDVLRAQRDFLERHLGQLVKEVNDKTDVKAPLYGEQVKALAAFVHMEIDRYKDLP